jgi:U4/U6.U5 tri-snRNP-associated protein 2
MAPREKQPPVEEEDQQAAGAAEPAAAAEPPAAAAAPPPKRARVAAAAAPSSHDDDGDDDPWATAPLPLPHSTSRAPLVPGRSCPYLDTVDRRSLDFDFERRCTVSLATLRVYCCLACGSYLQGRGLGSHAHAHALERPGHHLFLRLDAQGKVYCLPDGYEVDDRSLDDVRAVLNPRPTREEVAVLDGVVVSGAAAAAAAGAAGAGGAATPAAAAAAAASKASTTVARSNGWARALDGGEYMPGLVGLNNARGQGDYANVVVQALARVAPLRDFFLHAPEDALRGGALAGPSPPALPPAGAGFPPPPAGAGPLLTQRLAELMRKLWNPRAFKGHVAPNEFLLAVAAASGGRFSADRQADPVDFWAWLLNSLHFVLTAGRTRRRSVITDCFQGELEVEDLDGAAAAAAGGARVGAAGGAAAAAAAAGGGGDGAAANSSSRRRRVPFLMLSLDLPPAPLFKDPTSEKNILPQVPVAQLLRKFDGRTPVEVPAAGGVRRSSYRLTRLPSFLCLHVRRFTRNNFFVDKNPTLVTFPLRGLDLKDALPGLQLGQQQQGGGGGGGGGGSAANGAPSSSSSSPLSTRYDLIVNIVHDGTPGQRALAAAANGGPDSATLAGAEDGGGGTGATGGATSAVGGGAFRVHVQRAAEGPSAWYEAQDLRVSETLPQMVALSETYFQVWRRC